MSLQLLTVMVAGAGMGLIGLVYNSFAAYFMFAALVAVLLVAYASSRLSARTLAWRREGAGRVFEDEFFPVRIELENTGRLPRLLLAVADALPPLVGSDAEVEFVVPALWPGERVSLSYRARARKRGVYPLGPITVSASDPFGLFLHERRLGERSEAIIYPRPVELTGDTHRAGAEPRGVTTGERARWSLSGLDFYGIRDYRPGDELRRIHWPATARHASLKVIEYEHGASGDLAVVLDTREGAEYGPAPDTTLEVGVRAAASLVHWALAGEGHAFLAADSPQGPWRVEVERPTREHELLEALARVRADGALAPSEVTDWVGAMLPSGYRLCIITAAPDEGLPGVVGRLVEPSGGGLWVGVVLVDAASFDPRAGPSAAEPAEALARAGAAVTVLGRGDDVREALGRMLVAAD